MSVYQANGWLAWQAAPHGFGNDGRVLYTVIKIRGTRPDTAVKYVRCQVVRHTNQLCLAKRSRPLYGIYIDKSQAKAS